MISIKNLNKSFDDKNVLVDINLELELGGSYCLMGSSGIGKTTLTRILLGEEKFDSGEIIGVKIDDISVMYQENRLCMPLTVIENIALVQKGKIKYKEIVENIAKILPVECLNQPVLQLSGGMRRRVALARAMCFDSKFIILDEPFTGLDYKTKCLVIDYILEMKKDRTLLVITHGIEDAKLLNAKIINMEEIQHLDDKNLIENKFKVLSNTLLFKDINEYSYKEIIKSLRGYEKKYSKNDIVWSYYQEKNNLGIILKGSVQIEDISTEKLNIVQVFKEGDCFGEAFAFSDIENGIEVRAKEDTEILFLNIGNLLSNMHNQDIAQMTRNLFVSMTQKLLMLTRKNQLLLESSLRKKILMYFNSLDKNEDGGIMIPLLQKDIAQYLNVNKTSLSREISRMKDEGIIETKNDRIYILRPND